DPKQGANPTFSLVMMGAIIAVFWLFMIRPQAKKAKEQKKFIDNLNKGDKIVTIAGIHGTVNKINEDGTINLEVSPGSYLKIEKSAISMEWTAAINKAAATEKKESFLQSYRSLSAVLYGRDFCLAK
ncbi:MAG TPA: preprotein translocase subunit YajC, partial [Chitinophagaceae bacterium]|nr:preprotein translocase subunit YajC [Chitinophagaceae bacterium]